MKNKKDYTLVTIITSGLMLVGFLIICLYWKNREFNLYNIFYYILEYGFLVFPAIFFIECGINNLFQFFSNFIMPPRKVCLYIKNIYEYENGKYEYLFIDKNGKEYTYFFDKKPLEADSYYYVKKTRDFIEEIIGKSTEKFLPIKKIKYWTNWYNPFFSMENAVILPIFYIMIISGIYGFINFDAPIFCSIYISISAVFIVYDIIYKIKKNRVAKEIDSQGNLEEINIKSQITGCFILRLLWNIYIIAFGLFFMWLAVRLLNSCSDNACQILLSPFFIGGIAVIVKGILNFYKTIKNRINI